LEWRKTNFKKHWIIIFKLYKIFIFLYKLKKKKKKANELGRKAKENIEKGNIQEAANLYSDAAGN